MCLEKGFVLYMYFKLEGIRFLPCRKEIVSLTTDFWIIKTILKGFLTNLQGDLAYLRGD